MSAPIFPWSFALAPDVSLGADGDESRTVLRSPTEAFDLALPSRERGLLQALARRWCDEDGLRRAHAGGGVEDGAASTLLFRLERMGLLSRAVFSAGRLLVASAPLRRPPGPPPPDPTGRIRLSRFAALRRDEEGRAVLEAPGAWAGLVLHARELMPLLHDMATPAAVDDLVDGVAGCPPRAVLATLTLLAWCGLLDEHDGAAALWSADALAFHARTRGGYARRPLGKTWPFGPDEPVDVAPGRSGERVALPAPDLERLVVEDPPYALVAERRRSIRRQGAVPLSLAALSELLFRTLGYRGGRRPVPSAGARYPLETYLAVGRCDGLAPGVYAYRPTAHELRRRCGPGPGLTALLDGAARAAGEAVPPQVLVVLAARFARTQWMYGDLAYRLILEEVGAVFQAVGLAAAAMGLAACPLGVGDSRLFADLLGEDPLRETSVGEIALGST